MALKTGLNRTRAIRAAATRMVLMAVCAASASAQAPLSVAATEPYRFIAAHGHRAAIFGYAGRSLEVWGYPFQILDRYTVDFEPQSSPQILNGATLLTRVDVAPDRVVRIWTGPGFQVQETAFVPLDAAEASLSYQVTGRMPVDLLIHYRPVLNLMWPAAAGGQDVQWNDAIHGYLIAEASHGYRALVASEQIREHAPIVNATRREDLAQTFLLQPVSQKDGPATASVLVALLPPGSGSAQTAAQHIEQSWNEQAACRTYDDAVAHWNADSLAVTTPDEGINRAIEWAEADLDQAWACDDKIGCGAVAGFGPSRPMRRPQYDWFFAGDGMIAAEAMLATGHFERARQELAFVLRYQNPANGMIWHEISQSAGFLNWSASPYLYPHVDLTFQFLSTLGDYYAATADLPFLRDHWAAISAAYRFCRSLVDPATGLPLIPANKLGADEQDRMREDAGMSAAWVGAADAYTTLAQAAGHTQDAADAAAISQRARKAFAPRYWDNAEQFWISGYTAAGRKMVVRRSGPTAALDEHLLTADEESRMLDALAGAAFETDWGTRSLGADSPEYDPASYSKGSVSALHTAELASAFWDAKRPISAWQIWSGLVPWDRMTSPGHMEEVLTGETFQPQVESVPEQTWSSAGFLSAAVHGMLGIAVDAPAKRLTLAPHRLPGGGSVTVANIHAAGAVVAASFTWTGERVDVSLRNDGHPIQLRLAPELPPGASHIRARVNGRRVRPVPEPSSEAPSTPDRSGEEAFAPLDLLLPPGTTHCTIQYDGGVWIEIPRAAPQLGATSVLPRIRHIALHGTELEIDADIRAGDRSSLTLETPWRVASVEGGKVTATSATRTTVQFAPVTVANASLPFAPAVLRIRFAPGKPSSN